MKVSVLAIAGIATLASAAPLKIIVVSSSITPPSRTGPSEHGFNPIMPIRFGHAAASPNHGHTSAVPSHTGCGKFAQMSNRLRAALGMPALITTSSAPMHHSPNMASHADLHILPFVPGQRMSQHKPVAVEDMIKLTTTEVRPVDGSPMPSMRMRFVPVHMFGGAQRHHGHGMDDGTPFVHRLQRAMSNLGPWEGRAVAFVLGCGIGVLLRMFFVFTVLLFRSRRRSAASNEAEEQVIEYDAVLVEASTETTHFLLPRYDGDDKGTLILSAPAPEYTIVPETETKEETS
ncbi:hypothetical protein FRB95_011692 [Tulasnella sp. JGI-2019a]|nr:hypothetical protein FRB95_011692 [Tulasnella sp. JGI-2019a]